MITVLERLEQLISKENVDKIRTKKVAVVGLGGVGGYVVEALVRSGVEHIVLIDHDTVDITNKNRQLIALDSTLGMKKVEAWQKRIEDIHSICHVTTLDCFLTADNIDILDQYDLDYIVDTCDTIATKKALIMKSLALNIGFISCMGTGKRLDPSKLSIMDIRKTSYDPIAKHLRKFIRDEKITKKIMVVSSQEVPLSTPGRTVASASFVPASAGILIASYIIRQIIEND